MRRPINWIVVCVSLLFLVANVPFPGRKSNVPAAPMVMSAAEVPLSASLLGETAVPEFGYVRNDGSFVPLAEPEASPRVDADDAVLVWSAPRVATSQGPAAF